MLEHLIELAKLPAFGTAVGGVIALTGVVATLLTQSRARRTERDFTQRRDVYLKAAEAVAQQTHMLANMGNTALTPSDLANLGQDNPGWMNKVHMVASLKTIEKLNAVNEFSAAKALELIEQRIALDDLTHKIDGPQRELALLSDYQRQGSAALQAMAQQPSTLENQERFAWLVDGLKRSKDRGDELNKQLASLNQQRQQQHRKLIETSAAAAIEAQSHLVGANLAIRRELGLKIDERAYAEILQASGSRMSDRLKALLDKLDAQQR